jgi:hypothetical protein
MTGVCGLAGGVLCELVENGVNRVSGEENFQNKEEKTRFEKMMPVLKLIILFYAIYLSFRCKQRVDPKDLILSILFSPCYILYRLAVDNTDCTMPLFSTTE